MWKLGRVVKLVPGSDDKVRAAQVKLGRTGTIVNRTVNLPWKRDVVALLSRKK